MGCLFPKSRRPCSKGKADWDAFGALLSGTIHRLVEEFVQVRGSTSMPNARSCSKAVGHARSCSVRSLVAVSVLAGLVLTRL